MGLFCWQVDGDDGDDDGDDGDGDGDDGDDDGDDIYNSNNCLQNF